MSGINNCYCFHLPELGLTTLYLRPAAAHARPSLKGYGETRRHRLQPPVNWELCPALPSRRPCRLHPLFQSTGMGEGVRPVSPGVRPGGASP